jgi:hypothetical protein
MRSSNWYSFQILSDELAVLKEVISDSLWFFHTKVEILKILYDHISLKLPSSALNRSILISFLILHYLAPEFNIMFLIKLSTIQNMVSRDSIVGVATGYGLGDRGVGVRLPIGSRIFSSPLCPDWLWDPFYILFNG